MATCGRGDDMTFSRRSSGAWVALGNVQRRASGAWVTCANIYRRASGAWVKVWPTVVTVTFSPTSSDYSGPIAGGLTYGPAITVSPNQAGTYTWARDDSYPLQNTTSIAWGNAAGSTNGRTVEFFYFGSPPSIGATMRNRWIVTLPDGVSTGAIIVTFTRTS